MGVRRGHCLIAVALVLAAPPAVGVARPLGHLTPQRHGAAPRQKTVEIANYSFDIEQVLDIGSRSKAAGEGKVNFNPFHVTRQSDQVSPRLLQAAATGEAFQTIVLNTKRHGRRVKVVLHDVTISGYSRNGSRETFTMHPAYGQIAGQ